MPYPSSNDEGPPHGKKRVGCLVARVCLATLLLPGFVATLAAQDVQKLENEFFGSGATIAVKIHDPSGQPLASQATVKLFRGVVPSGQREASNGAAEFIVGSLGEFTVVVSAAGYSEAQKDVSVSVNGRTQVDVYLQLASGGAAAVPGKPLLAPKAKEALDQGILAFKQNRLAEAERRVAEAVRLAPGNPDVLYVQGVLSLKQGNWEQARAVLEKATQIDPNSSPAFAALGMSFCDSGKYDAAIAPLEKSLQLDAVGAWQTRWALAKAYYYGQRFEEALKMSQEALAQSRGEEPKIALLVAQSLTALGRYEEAAQVLREFLREHADHKDAATAKRWLDQLAANGKTTGK
jgi:thioredoxin-like negative regulator of GroEL